MIMIKFENTEVVGWEAAIRGMRNPMNSWEKGDSGHCRDFLKETVHGIACSEECPWWSPDSYCGYSEKLVNDSAWDGYIIGPNDHKLMMSLAKGGPVHAKYRRMITVYVDITAPIYWWKEFDTYKVGTVANSCSTMHKIHEKEFTLEDFSREHLQGPGIGNLEATIKLLNYYRELFNGTIESERRDGLDGSKIKKDWWWQMIQLLPSSYNQRRTVMLNYEVLAGIYQSRKDHKLDEWHDFCDWIESLPYSEIITCEADNVRERNGEKSNE